MYSVSVDGRAQILFLNFHLPGTFVPRFQKPGLLPSFKELLLTDISFAFLYYNSIKGALLSHKGRLIFPLRPTYLLSKWRDTSSNLDLSFRTSGKVPYGIGNISKLYFYKY